MLQKATHYFSGSKSNWILNRRFDAKFWYLQCINKGVTVVFQYVIDTMGPLHFSIRSSNPFSVQQMIIWWYWFIWNFILSYPSFFYVKLVCIFESHFLSALSIPSFHFHEWPKYGCTVTAGFFQHFDAIHNFLPKYSLFNSISKDSRLNFILILFPEKLVAKATSAYPEPGLTSPGASSTASGPRSGRPISPLTGRPASRPGSRGGSPPAVVPASPATTGSGCAELAGVHCRLETKDLWDKFHELGTEMIITKSGRYAPFFHLFFSFLTHWGQDKITAISQTTLSIAFSWMKMLEFRLNFHWSLFLRVQLTIIQHCFR